MKRLFPLLILLMTLPALAGNWYVLKSASGTNAGTSWTNAWNELNQINFSSVACGDTIWIGGGAYTTDLTVAKTCTSGNVLNIWSVLASDTVPVAAAGYTTAVLSQVQQFSNNGINVDPASFINISGRQGIPGSSISYGWSVQCSTNCDAIEFGQSSPHTETDITIAYLELYGPPCVTSGGSGTGSCTGDTHAVDHGQDVLTNLTLDHMWMHRWAEIVRPYQWTNYLIQYSDLDTTRLTPDEHEDVVYAANPSAGTMRYNVIWGSPNDGIFFDFGGNSLTFYGNAYFDSGGALITFKSGFTNGTVIMHNNTFSSNEVFGDFVCPSNCPWIDWTGTPSSITMSDNVFDHVGFSGSPSTGDHNSYSTDVGAGDSGTGTNTYTSSFSANTQFEAISTSNPIISNYRLTSVGQTAFQAGGSLSSPYTADMDGNTRGAQGQWYRGAYDIPNTSALQAIVILPPNDGYHITPAAGSLQLTAVCYSTPRTLTTAGVTMPCPPDLTWWTNDSANFVVTPTAAIATVTMGLGYGGVITSATRNSAGTISTITTTSNLTQTCSSGTVSCGIKSGTNTVTITGVTDTSFNVTAIPSTASTNTITIPNVGTASASSSGGQVWRTFPVGYSVIGAFSPSSTDPVTSRPVFGYHSIIIDSTPTVTSLAWRPETATSTSIVVGTTVMASAVDATINSTSGLEIGDYATWTSSDATKCTVDNVGLIFGVAAGTCTVTATYRGNTINRAITVVAPTLPNNTWYVRPGGGTRWDAAVTSGQCSGLVDADYPGTGTNQNCAFNNPMYLFTDETSSSVYTGSVLAGDTAIVSQGTYNMGGKSSSVNWITNKGSAILVPSGTPAQHTRILSACFLAGTCNTSNPDAVGLRPVLIAFYGAATNGTYEMFFLNGAQNIDIQGFEIDASTDCNKGATNLVDWACPNNISSFALVGDDFTANVNLSNRVRGFVYGWTGTPGPNLAVTGNAVEGNYLTGVSLDDPFGFNGNRSYGFTSLNSDYGFSGCTPEPLKAVTAASRDGAGNEVLTFDPTVTEVNYLATLGTKVVVTGMTPSDLNGTFVTNGITFNQDSVNINGVTCVSVGTVNLSIKCTISTTTQAAFPAHAFVQISSSAVSFLNNIPLEVLSVGTNTVVVWSSGFSSLMFGGTAWFATTSATTAGTIAVANQVSVTAAGGAETASVLGTATHVFPYHDCMDQGDNGNGDAFGTGNTTRGNGTFKNNVYRYSMQDGLDEAHSTVPVQDIENNLSFNNEGAPYKYGNSDLIIFKNNIAIGTGGYMFTTDPNRPPDFNQYFSLPYRAGDGQPFVVHSWTNAVNSNNTNYSGFATIIDDTIADADGCFPPICTGVGVFVFQNQIFGGFEDEIYPGFGGSMPAIYFKEGNNETWTWLNNMGYLVRNPPTGGSGNNYTEATAPFLTPIPPVISNALANANAQLGVNVNQFSGSPANGFGIHNSFTPSTDNVNYTMSNPPVTGALMFQSSGAPQAPTNLFGNTKTTGNVIF